MAQQLMELEVAQHVGAHKYERSTSRSGERNGYRERPWDTRVGSIELHIYRALAKPAAADAPLGAQVRVLVTIPGLGLTTAGALLASPPLDRLETPPQVAAYVGLCPQERSSASAVRGRSHIGPLGPASLRKALYMPAVVAMRANPALRVFAGRPACQG
jgi:transposase